MVRELTNSNIKEVKQGSKIRLTVDTEIQKSMC